MSSFAKQRDLNEGPIVDALERAGAAVTRLPGFGVPDLLVGYNGETFLLEVKNPYSHSKTGRKRTDRSDKTGVGGGELTDRQVRWWTEWRGRPPVIVCTPEEALAAIGADLVHAVKPPPPKAPRKPRARRAAPNQLDMRGVEDRGGPTTGKLVLDNLEAEVERSDRAQMRKL